MEQTTFNTLGNVYLTLFTVTCDAIINTDTVQKTYLTLGSITIFFSEPSDLELLVHDNSTSNFFIDEAPVAGKKFSTETLANISKKVSRNNYLWIACQSDKAPHKEDVNLGGNYLRLNTN